MDQNVKKMQEIIDKQAKQLEQQDKIIAAAVSDLNTLASCRTCGNLNSFCESNPDSCSGYKWRGVPGISMEDIASEPAVSSDVSPAMTECCREQVFEKSYVDMLNDLQDAITSDETIPATDKVVIMEKLWGMMSIMWKYSA